MDKDAASVCNHFAIQLSHCVVYIICIFVLSVFPIVDWAESGKMYIFKVVEAFHVYGWQTTFLDVFIGSKSI